MNLSLVSGRTKQSDFRKIRILSPSASLADHLHCLTVKELTDEENDEEAPVQELSTNVLTIFINKK